MRFSQRLASFIFTANALGMFTAQSHADDVVREHKPLELSIGAGHPAPSYVGGAFSYQPNWAFQWVVSTGVFLTSDLKIQTLSGELRWDFFPYDISPMVGAGFSAFFFNGSGDIQGLDESTLLGSLLVGADITFENGFRLTGGLQFHYPVKLIFPFVEAGIAF